MNKKILIGLVALLLGLSAVSAYAADELRRNQCVIPVGSNSITVENNVKYVNYLQSEVLTVTLNFSGTANIMFSGLALRMPNSFTPKGTLGTLSNVTGLPTAPALTGSVTFNLTFDQFKAKGKKKAGVAHLDLFLGVDEDGDGEIDETLKVGVQISASTVAHP